MGPLQLFQDIIAVICNNAIVCVIDFEISKIADMTNTYFIYFFGEPSLQIVVDMFGNLHYVQDAFVLEDLDVCLQRHTFWLQTVCPGHCQYVWVHNIMKG